MPIFRILNGAWDAVHNRRQKNRVKRLYGKPPKRSREQLAQIERQRAQIDAQMEEVNQAKGKAVKAQQILRTIETAEKTTDPTAKQYVAALKQLTEARGGKKIVERELTEFIRMCDLLQEVRRLRGELEMAEAGRSRRWHTGNKESLWTGSARSGMRASVLGTKPMEVKAKSAEQVNRELAQALYDFNLLDTNNNQSRNRFDALGKAYQEITGNNAGRQYISRIMTTGTNK